MRRMCVIAIAAIVAVGQTRIYAQTPSSMAKQKKPSPNLRLEHADVPTYPELALTARAFGTVRVLVSVRGGKVTNTRLQSGPPILTAATIENIRTWRFQGSVNATFTTWFVYQLERASLDAPSNPKIELELPLHVKITAVPIPLDSKTGGW